MDSIYILGIDLGTSGIRATVVKRQVTALDTTETIREENAFKPTAFRLPTTDQDTLIHTIMLPQSQSSPAQPSLKQRYANWQTVFAQSDANSASAAKVNYAENWISQLDELLKKLAQSIDLAIINHVIIDATSSTVLLANADKSFCTPALMYNDQQAVQESQKIAHCFYQNNQKSEQELNQKPVQNSADNTAVLGASSTLAKVCWLQNRVAEMAIDPSQITSTQPTAPLKIWHQTDWLNDYLCDTQHQTDWNNALKLGFDPISETWPSWISALLAQDSITVSLPRVQEPGTRIAKVRPEVAKKYGFNPNLQCHFGTTDSIAGFLAAGASQTGDAVSSLGSTLAIKQLINKPVFAAESGLYSHKIGKVWLVGGASNSGGKVLLAFYPLPTLTGLLELIHVLAKHPATHCHFVQQAQQLIDKHQSHLADDFYPLLQKGERFPVNDADFSGALPKLPADPLSLELIEQAIAVFRSSYVMDKAIDKSISKAETKAAPKSEQFNALLNENPTSPQRILLAHITCLLQLLQGLTYVEKLAYQTLAEKSGVPLKGLFSVGGGTKNLLWQNLRTQFISRQTQIAFSGDAAYGVTRLVQI